ncbi:MAG TPA: ABC transporter ATP-binding protein/permease, partial [Candidatus Dojkabacteria bacterium]|nr:ABC transporter ATP-binding protein/permease [Candidatus Dojkabacteria bacterium]
MIASGIVILQAVPILIVMSIVVAMPDSIVWAIYSKHFWDYYSKYTQKWRVIDQITDTMIDEQDIFENKITASDEKFFKQLKSKFEQLFSTYAKMRKKSTTQSQVLVILDFVREAFIPLFLIYKVLTENLTLGYFSFYSNRAFSFSSQLTDFLNIAVDMYDNGLALADIKRIMELQPAIENGFIKLNNHTAPVIELKHVWFKYPKGKKWILKDINMKINPSEEIAIVGENGAGKSTLIKLILRFYDVTRGEILINGRSIKKLDLKSYYNIIGVLFQDYNVYKFLNVEENIQIASRKGVKPLPISKAIKFADAEKFINELQYGLKQVIS